MQDNINLKQIAGKSLFYDGTDDTYYDNHICVLDNGDKVAFSYSELIDLGYIEDSDKSHVLKFILKTCPNIYRFSPTPNFFGYKNDDNLNVSLKETEKYFIIIAHGESQPGRYKIYIESIFEKTNF